MFQTNLSGTFEIIKSLMDFFGQGLVLVYPSVIVFWIIFHSKIERLRGVGRRAYWVALLAWALLGFPLLYYHEAVFAVRWPMPWWLKTVGVAVTGLALWIGRQAYRVIPTRTLIGLPELQPQENVQPLLQTGIYQRTRNPVYLTHILLLVSAVCFTGYLANAVLLAFDAVCLPWMIRAEERELRQRYGFDYADYMARVPRLFPKLFR